MDVKKPSIPVPPKKLKKVKEAEDLVSESSGGTDEQKRIANTKAAKIYTEMCLNGTIGPDDKIGILESFLKTVPEDGKEMLVRMRDFLPFCRGKEQDNLVKLLVLICKNPEIDSHERSIIASTLYNQVFFDVCYECFKAIALDKLIKADYRVDACRYLFGSGEDTNKEISQECLLEILSDLSLSSSYRYKIISSFISRTGFSTFLNTGKIKVRYDESFVCALQTCFFYQESNGIRERILSGQHMLSMECVDEEEKIKIGNIFIGVGKSADYDENTRADALDVVLRLGTPSQTEEARKLIIDLGYSALGKGDKKNILNHVKTIYSNSQNVHDEKIAECVNKFIEKVITSEKGKAPRLDFILVHKEVVDLLKKRKLPPNKKFNALSALNRVKIDTATFTKYNISISEVFVHVWARIQSFSSPKEADTKSMLEDRLIEELVDMGDTCSTGHAGRFVNVLATVDVDLRISYESQIIANLAGRINARIRDCENQDLRASIAMGMMPNSDEEDLQALRKFLATNLPIVKEELYKEFVGDKYISATEFELYYNSAVKQWEK